MGDAERFELNLPLLFSDTLNLEKHSFATAPFVVEVEEVLLLHRHRALNCHFTWSEGLPRAERAPSPVMGCDQCRPNYTDPDSSLRTLLIARDRDEAVDTDD